MFFQLLVHPIKNNRVIKLAFMFILFSEEYQRVIYMMGYVYYPNEEKRDMMKQVDAILNTMVIDYKDKEEKTK